MSIGDDDDALGTGTEGQGPEGQEPAGGQQETDLSAEHADDEADGGEQEVEAEADGQAEQPTRGQARHQRLANEARAAREEAAAARREVEELRRQQWQTQNARSEQEERERLALVTAEERAEYRIAQSERNTSATLRQMQISNAAMMDKAAYDAEARVNPVYAKHRDVIEQQFQEQLRKGQPVERQVLLQNHIGKLALDAARNPKPRRQAQSRVESQRVAAASGRSDTASSRGRAGDTAETRLKDVYI